MKEIKTKITYSIFFSTPWIAIIGHTFLAYFDKLKLSSFNLIGMIISGICLGCIWLSAFNEVYKYILYRKKFKDFDLQELDKLIDEYDFLIKKKEKQYKKLKKQ